MSRKTMNFDKRKVAFEALCTDNDVPVPLVSPSLPEDLCDFTDHRTVRLNLAAAEGVDPMHHVAHVWGHYICCLHEWADGQTGCAKITDLVADSIARLALDGYRR